MQRNSKYNAKKTIFKGIKFDSQKEAQRYGELLLMEKGKLITNIKLQPKYELQEKYRKNGKGIRAICYIADFEYLDLKTNKLVIEDVKSDYTRKNPLYKVKKKMFEYKYKELEIKEII